MTQTIGKVYAEALFELAKDSGTEKRIYNDLNEAAQLLQAYPDLIMLLSVPTLSIEERLDVLHKVFGTEQGLMHNFLSLLVEKHRIDRIDDIRRAFNEMYNAAFGIAEVIVTTAVPLEDAQRMHLIQNMQKKLQKKIQLIEKVDGDILGGMIVQYGDTRMDNSLRSRVRELSRTLEN